MSRSEPIPLLEITQEFFTSPMWHDTIKVEGENDEMRVNTSGGMDYIRSAWENELNPAYKDVEIYGSRYF